MAVPLHQRKSTPYMPVIIRLWETLPMLMEHMLRRRRQTIVQVSVPAVVRRIQKTLPTTPLQLHPPKIPLNAIKLKIPRLHIPQTSKTHRRPINQTLLMEYIPSAKSMYTMINRLWHSMHAKYIRKEVLFI